MRSTLSASKDSRSSSSARKHWDKMKKGTASTHRPSRRKKRCSLMRAARRELVSHRPCAGPVSLARVSYYPYLRAPTKRLCSVKKWDPEPEPKCDFGRSTLSTAPAAFVAAIAGYSPKLKFSLFLLSLSLSLSPLSLSTQAEGN